MSTFKFPSNPVPATLNGHPVVAALPLPCEPGMKDGCVVVVDMEKPGAGGVREFCASVHAYGTEGWYQGHYMTLGECLQWARKEFERRVSRAAVRDI